jgi:hypothetical protein
MAKKEKDDPYLEKLIRIAVAHEKARIQEARRESKKKVKPIRLHVPPFPRLTWNGSFWEGKVHLEAWRGFISIREFCPWVTRGGLPDGDLRLHVSSPVNDKPEPPNQEQITSFQHLLDHQKTLREAVLRAVFEQYPRWKKCYAGFVDEQMMPAISDASALTRLIRPGGVHVMANPKNGFTFIGFEFACKWDEEHGLGVLTHRGTVISTGGADEAFREYFPVSKEV